ncbi:MAG TPA: class I SAM-dependent methyltransferase [Phenylobacterium sp.]|nr:class I SAM-dependent methyltransferase [Phenylobacterium sp.]
MTQPDWWYDDLKQVGLDFDDAHEVATYDDRQRGSAQDDRALLQRLGVTRETAMADIGCGTGLLACQGATLARSVRAIDISAAMLARARERGAALGVANIAFERAGFLTFAASGDLDLIVSKFALHHLPDMWKAVALTRMRDALKPGGRIYIRDVAFNGPPDALPRAVESWIGWMTRESGYVREDVACHVREEHSTFGWVVTRMVEEAGFRLIEQTHEGVYASWWAEAVA